MSRPANSQWVPGCSTRSKSPLRSSRPRSFFFTVTRWIIMRVLLVVLRVWGGGAVTAAVASDECLGPDATVRAPRGGPPRPAVGARPLHTGGVRNPGPVSVCVPRQTLVRLSVSAQARSLRQARGQPPPATTRTRNLPLTRRLLWLLSYGGDVDPLWLCPHASIPS